MDLSPNYAPTIIAIVNTCGAVMGGLKMKFEDWRKIADDYLSIFAGILAPLAVGLLTPNVSMKFGGSQS